MHYEGFSEFVGMVEVVGENLNAFAKRILSFWVYVRVRILYPRLSRSRVVYPPV